MHNAKERTVTSTYNPAIWFLFAKHHLIMVIIYAYLFFKIPQHITKLLARNEQDSLKPIHKVEERIVTTTFNLVVRVLIATHHRIMINISAKLFSNPTMHNKVMGWIRTGFTEVYAQNLSADCDLDLSPRDMVLIYNITSCHDDYLCQISFKSHHALQSYGLDTNRFH